MVSILSKYFSNFCSSEGLGILTSMRWYFLASVRTDSSLTLVVWVRRGYLEFVQDVGDVFGLGRSRLLEGQASDVGPEIAGRVFGVLVGRERAALGGRRVAGRFVERRAREDLPVARRPRVLRVGKPLRRRPARGLQLQRQRPVAARADWHRPRLAPVRRLAVPDRVLPVQRRDQPRVRVPQQRLPSLVHSIINPDPRRPPAPLVRSRRWGFALDAQHWSGRRSLAWDRLALALEGNLIPGAGVIEADIQNLIIG